MKFDKQSVTLLSNLEIHKKIETCGRIAWQSEPKENDTPEAFVERIMNRRHFSVLEHAAIHVDLPIEVINKLPRSAYLYIVGRHVSGNARAWFELFDNHPFHPECKAIQNYFSDNFSPVIFKKNKRIKAATYLIESSLDPAFKHDTFILVTDRGITHELVRHRVLSFTQESTRYVKYNDLRFINPQFPATQAFGDFLCGVEKLYGQMLDAKIPPQFARSILPNCLRAQIAVSGFDFQWDGFYRLRMQGAHPQIMRLALTMKTAQEHRLHETLETGRWYP